MGYRRMRRLAGSMLILITLVGCLETKSPLHYFGDAELQYYRETATQIDYPHVHSSTPDEVKFSDKPRTLLDSRTEEIWDMTLVEALHTSMANSRVIRSEQTLSQANPMLSNPRATPTVYDPAIQDTGVLFGGRGLEDALAAFDAQFTTTMLWGRDEIVQNNLFFAGGLSPGSTLTGETGNFTSQLSKQFAYGGALRVSQNWDYQLSNVPGQLFPSSYRGALGVEYRHPLWAGAGTEFTRIAGPITQSFGGLSGVNQGVVIARINHDLSLADFEAAVRNMLFDVEKLYWDLYLSYRVYDTAITARNSALRTWREAKAKLDIGGVANFKPADEAQARDRYFQTRAQAEAALSQVYTDELELRRILGLPVNDGRIIRPADEPVAAKFVPDWYICLTEALTRRVELRKQKWQIKSLDLQLKAAKSLVNPRLDFVSGYRVNAFGDRLFGENDKDGLTAQGFHSAYESLTQGNQTGWNLGFEFTMPLGFRSANAQVQNVELRLAKARDILAALELDVSHELAAAFQSLVQQYATAQTNFNRRRAAQRRVELFEAELRAGTTTLDLVLRAQASLADAEVAYYTSLTEYNKEIALLHLRKGTLLEQNDVHLSEGHWTPQAYRESLRRAWARSHAIDSKWQHTEPEEFVLPGFTGDVEFAPEGPSELSEDEDAGLWRPRDNDELTPERTDESQIGVPPAPAAIPDRADENPPQKRSPTSEAPGWKPTKSVKRSPPENQSLDDLDLQ